MSGGGDTVPLRFPKDFHPPNFLTVFPAFKNTAEITRSTAKTWGFSRGSGWL